MKREKPNTEIFSTMFIHRSFKFYLAYNKIKRDNLMTHVFLMLFAACKKLMKVTCVYFATKNAKYNQSLCFK